MLRAQLQVLVAVIILLAQHWHRWCMGPCPRTTQTPLSLTLVHVNIVYIYIYTLFSPTEVLHNTPKVGKSSGQAAKLHSHNEQATDKLITHLIFF